MSIIDHPKVTITEYGDHPDFRVNPRTGDEQRGHCYCISGNVGFGFHSVKVHGPDLFRYRQGAYVQDAFPYLSDGDREWLLTGISPAAWDEFMGPEDREGEDESEATQ